MGYALQSLLRIRLLREDRASGELTVARQAVAAAQATLDERIHELEEFNQTRENRRDRIYETIIGHAVTREQLDLAQEGVARIDEEGVLKADNVIRAKSDLHTREEEAKVAHANFVIASKDRMKIDEHKANWVLADAKEQEHRTEIELEDFTGRKQNLDD